jgi:hypothetical protein
MAGRLESDSDAQDRSPKNSRQRQNDIINVNDRNTKLFILGLVLCLAVLSIKSSRQQTSRINFVGMTRFDILYDAKEGQMDGMSDNIAEQLSSNEQNGHVNNTNAGEIQVLLPPKQIQWMKNRVAYFSSFYEIPFDNGTDERLHSPADNNGPILDFVVAGFPKCGKV